MPMLRLSQRGDVEREPASLRNTAPRASRIAGDPDNAVPGLDQPRDDSPADQPGRSGHEHAHALL